MSQEQLSDSQAEQLRIAALRHYRRQIAAGRLSVESSAAWSATDEVGIADGIVDFVLTNYLTGQTRQTLYGPGVSMKDVDPQG